MLKNDIKLLALTVVNKTIIKSSRLIDYHALGTLSKVSAN